MSLITTALNTSTTTSRSANAVNAEITELCVIGDESLALYLHFGLCTGFQDTHQACVTREGHYLLTGGRNSPKASRVSTVEEEDRNQVSV